MSYKFLLIVVSCYFLAGCAATGTSFDPTIINGEDSTIVFFRPKEFVGGGVKLAITEDGERLFKIMNGQYIVHNTSAGEKTYIVDHMGIGKPFKLNIKRGETYFVRLEHRTGSFKNTLFLTRVYEEEALEELKECCKSGK